MDDIYDATDATDAAAREGHYFVWRDAPWLLPFTRLRLLYCAHCDNYFASR